MNSFNPYIKHSSWRKEAPRLILMYALPIIITMLVYHFIGQFIPIVFGGWLNGYGHRKSHNIAAIVGGSANYQMKIKAHYDIAVDDQQIDAVELYGPQITIGRVIHYNNKLYWAAMEAGGTTLYACEYDLATETFTKVTLPYTAPSSDSHYIPKFWQDKDGYFFAFCGYSTTGIYSMKSTNPNSIALWDSEVQICTYGSYPFPYQNPSGRIYIMYRRQGTLGNKWRFAYSDNGGANWTPDTDTIWPSNLGSTQCFYCFGHWDLSNTRLHITAVGSRTSPTAELRDNLYYGYSDDYGVTWKDINGVTKTDVADLLIWTGYASRAQMNLDENDYPIIAVGVRDATDDEAEHDVHLHSWNGSTWTRQEVTTNYNSGWLAGKAIHKIGQRIYIVSYYLPVWGGSDQKSVLHYADPPYTTWTEKWINDQRLASAGAVVNVSGQLYYVYNAHYYPIGSRLARFPEGSNGSVGLNENCRTDFGDVRFTDDDGVTELDYWIVTNTKVDGEYAEFWVEVKDDISSNQSIYIYYGNATATYTNPRTHGEDTFPFFDGEGWGGAVDWASKWESTNQSLYSISGGKLRINWTATPSQLINSQNNFTDFAVEVLWKGSDVACDGYLELTDTKAVPWNRDFAHLYFPNNNMCIKLGATGTCKVYPKNITPYYKKILMMPSSGNGRGEIWEDTLFLCVYENVPYYQSGVYHGMYQRIGGFALIDYTFIRKYVPAEGISQNSLHGSWASEEIPSGSFWIGKHQVAGRHQEPVDDQLSISHKVTWGN